MERQSKQDKYIFKYIWNTLGWSCCVIICLFHASNEIFMVHVNVEWLFEIQLVVLIGWLFRQISFLCITCSAVTQKVAAVQGCEQGPLWVFVLLAGLCSIYHMTPLKSLEMDGIDTLHSLPVSHALRIYLEPKGGLLTDWYGKCRFSFSCSTIKVLR